MSRFMQTLFGAIELAAVAAFIWGAVVFLAQISPGAYPQ